MTDQRQIDEEIIAATVRRRMSESGHGFRRGLYEAAHAALADVDPSDKERRVDALFNVIRTHEIREGETK